MRTALPRPLWMSIPEWPPCRPETRRRQPSPERTGRRAILRRATLLMPPAQPIQSVPSSSPSRFRKYFARSSPAGNSEAPVRPLSSSMVKRNSNGPWATSSLSITASAAATPTPLSAPSVVPSAFNQSPSRTRRMGSVSKLWAVPSFFSQTMSRLPCRAALTAMVCEKNEGPAHTCDTDRVQVALQGGHDGPLAPEPGGLADHGVADLVLDCLKPQAGGQGQDIVACLSLFFGGAGYRRESLEVLPKGLGLQVFQCSFHKGSV